MERKRILTGDRPTGKLHLGHYVGSIENRLRQNQTVSHDDGNIGPETGEGELFFGGFEADRVAYRDAECLGAGLHRAWPVLLAAPRRTRRLAIDRDNLMRGGQRV